MILVQLPGRKIFTLQRVSKFWKANIQYSPTIQKKLFLRPKGESVGPSLKDAEKLHLEYPEELELNLLPSALVEPW